MSILERILPADPLEVAGFHLEKPLVELEPLGTMLIWNTEHERRSRFKADAALYQGASGIHYLIPGARNPEDIYSADLSRNDVFCDEDPHTVLYAYRMFIESQRRCEP